MTTTHPPSPAAALAIVAQRLVGAYTGDYVGPIEINHLPPLEHLSVLFLARTMNDWARVPEEESTWS